MTAGTGRGALPSARARAALRVRTGAPARTRALTALAACLAALGVLACALAVAGWLLGLTLVAARPAADGPAGPAVARAAAPAQVRPGSLVAFADPAARGAVVSHRVARAAVDGQQVVLDVAEGGDRLRRVALAVDARVAVLAAPPAGGPVAGLLVALLVGVGRMWLPAAALAASVLLLAWGSWWWRRLRARAPAGAGRVRRVDRRARQGALRRLLLVTVGVAGLVAFSASLAVAGFSAVFANTSSLSAAGVFTPTGLAASSGLGAQVPLTWNSLTGATDYRVQWRTNGSGSWTATAWTTSTSTAVTALTNGTTYEFQVQARNGSGSSAWSSSVTATPAGAAVPTGLAVSSGLDAQLPVSWTAVPGAADYQVQWRTNGSGSWTATGWTTSTSASLTGLSNNSTYEVQVQARDAQALVSGWSASVTGTPRQWAQVSTGISSSCAVTVSGRAYCWGHNDAGQLGDGTFGVDRLLPVPVDTSTGLTTTNVASIAAGGEMWDGNSASTCAITTAGKLYCWGLNNYGQVGDGTYTNRLTPVAVDTSTGLATAKQVSSGNGWVCAVSTGGQAFCWGHDYWGELGTASVSWSPRPAAVDTTTGLTATNVASISAFAFSTCAVTTGGRGYCWGAGGSGALGNNSTSNSAVPTPVDTTTGLTTTNVAHISVGWSGACARTTGGQAYCWGDGEAGQVGNGSPWIPPASSPTTPVAVDTSTGLTTTNVARLGAGYWHTCAVTTGASAYCWGAGGTIGDGTGNGYGSPRAVSTSTGLTAGTVAAVDARGNPVCALQTAASGGSVFCWGPGGLVGDGTSAQRLSPAALATTPIPAAPAGAPTGAAGASPQDGQVTVTWTALAGAGDYQVQWRTNGSGSWTSTASTTGTSTTVTGLNDTTTYEFQVRAHTAGGFGPWASSVTAVPNGPPAAPSGLAASSGLEAQAPVSWSAASGAVDYQVQWRTNGAGSWTATSWTTSTSTTVPGLVDNTVYEFQVRGRNAQGTGAWSASVTGTPRQWAQVSAGWTHTCAVTVSGRAYCWGLDSYGQIGDGTSGLNRAYPVPVDTTTGLTTTNVASISAGYYHTCAVTTAGRAYCWGYNGNGAVGDNTWNNARLTPTPVDTTTGLTTTNVASIRAGAYFTCAVTTAGQAYCWGSNVYGQAGTGTAGGSLLQPAAVSTSTGLTATNVAALTAGGYHACAVTTAGQAYCWGHNPSGQVGDGTSGTDRPSPTAVTVTTGLTATNVARVAAGDVNSCAVTTGGQAYCWGDDTNGQIGDNAFGTVRVNPTAVNTGTGLTATNVSRISLGDLHACALTTGGQVYCWGHNANGQVGDGTIGTDRLTPTAVSTGMAGLTGTNAGSIDLGGLDSCALTTAAAGGTVYCWGGEPNNQLGDGTNANALAPVTPLTTTIPAAPSGAPTGLAATSNQNAQVPLTWSALSGAADYQVQWRTNGTGSWTTTDSTTGTSATVTGLTNGTTYEFQVRGHTAGGFGAWTTSVTATPNIVPATPAALAATAGKDGQVPLTWNASTGATYYEVQWRTNGSGSWTTEVATTGTSYTVMGLADGTLYEFQVHAGNAIGTSAWSASVTATPAAPGAPAYQTGATSSGAAGTSNTVAAPANVANGDLLVAMVTTNAAATGMSLGNAGTGAAWGAAKSTQTCPTGGNNCEIWVFTKIASGESGNYTFSWTGSYRSLAAVVRITGANTAGAVEAWATGNSGTSGSPMANSVTTLGANRLLVALIGTDAKQTVVAGTSGMTGISDNNNNVNGYTGAAFQASQAGAGASGTKTFSIGGGVAWATTMLAAVPAALPATPTGLAVTGGQANQAPVSWSSVPGALDYKVRYRVNGTGPWTPTGFGTPASTTITGLSQGTTYEFQVKSRNSAGESAWSSSVTATP